MCACARDAKAVPVVGKLVIAHGLVHGYRIWNTSSTAVARLCPHRVVGAILPTRILHIQTSENTSKLRLKIGEHLVNGIAATLVGVNVTAVKANDTVVPTVWNVKVIRIRWADNRDGWCNIHREYGWVNARKGGGTDRKPTIVIVLRRVEAGIQNFCDAVHKWAAESHVDGFVGTDANFEVGNVLVHYNIEIAAVVIGE